MIGFQGEVLTILSLHTTNAVSFWSAKTLKPRLLLYIVLRHAVLLFLSAYEKKPWWPNQDFSKRLRPINRTRIRTTRLLVRYNLAYTLIVLYVFYIFNSLHSFHVIFILLILKVTLHDLYPLKIHVTLYILHRKDTITLLFL